MGTIVQNFLEDMRDFQYDPTRLIQRNYQMLEDVTNGTIDIVDPTSPFAYLMESTAVNVAGFMEKHEVGVRRQYASLAQVQEELYLHMSDKDYIGRFALPATTSFTLMMPVDETINRMVYDPVLNIDKLVIPRNTYFTVADTVFSLQYPIVISKQQHSGLNVLFDIDIQSPLQTLATNVVSKKINKVNDVEWLILTFDVQQFKILSKTESITTSKEFSKTITFEDKFYYARIYMSDSQGKWVEMRTTHTDQVYDATIPTAVLKVVDDKLTVRIPQVYVSNGLVKGRIRMDVYQTKGLIEMDLSSYPAASFGATWENFDKNEDTVYVAPIRAFREIIPLSDSYVYGGRDALSFEQLRTRVIGRTSSADKVLPITTVQLTTVLEDEGFEVIRNVDNLTKRVFLATRPMPDPTDLKLITAAAAAMETISIKAEEAVLLDTVVDNGTSITLLPGTIYRNVNGVTKLVPSAQVAQLLSLPADKIAAAVTGGGYGYSPFHYVLDMSRNEFAMRAYFLSRPVALTKSSIMDNDSTQLQVATAGYGIFKKDNGFTIQILTQSSQNYRDLNDELCHVQLAYVPAGERDRAYINGTFAGRNSEGERIFNFDLATTFNVDANDKLELTKFFMYTTEDRITGAGLETTFDILYSVSATMDVTWERNSIDQILGHFLLPSQIAGVTHEKLDIRFGYALKTLWTRARTVVAASPYQTWDVDVPMVYESDVPERDPQTGASVKFVNGVPTINFLHHKGDSVLTPAGVPVYKYRKGDIKLDGNGMPIPVGPRSLLHHVDIMLIEGVYWFANDSSAQNYREEMVTKLLGWLVNDLGKLTSNLLELTYLYFYPKNSQGFIDVNIGDNVITSIPAAQSFKLSLQVPEKVYRDEALRKQLLLSSIRTLQGQLQQKTVAMATVISTLKENYGNDVAAFSVTGLGGSLNLAALTVKDDVNRCSLRKKLEALPDGSLIVSEDVTVDFVLAAS